MKQSPVISYLLNTLLTIALCALYCVTEGLLSAVAGILISAMLAIVFNHNHYGLGLANSALVMVILVLFLGPLPGITSGVPLILLALSLAMGTMLKLSVYKLLTVCTVLFTASAIANMMLLGHLTDGEITLSSMILDMGKTMRETLAAQSADPALGGNVEQMIKQIVDLCIKVSPAMFIIISAVESFLLVAIYKKLEQRRNTDMNFLLPFRRWQADKGIAITYLVLILLSFAVPEGMFFNVLLNVVMAMSFVFAVLGLSVFVGRQKGRLTTGKIIILILLCFLSAFFAVVGLVLLISGVADSFLDYRKLRKEN